MADYRSRYLGWECQYEPIPLKSGKPGKRLRMVSMGYHTKLSNCERCGRLGSPRYVHCRGDVYGWEWPLDGRGYPVAPPGEYHSKTRLCMACWNFARAIERKKALLAELRKGIKELGSAVWHERKTIRENDGRAA